MLSFYSSFCSRRCRRKQQQTPRRSPRRPRPSQRRSGRLRVSADLDRQVQDVGGGGLRARHRNDSDQTDGIQKSCGFLFGN